jgi:hypothetical protein
MMAISWRRLDRATEENLIKRRSRNVSSWRQSLLIALDVDDEDQSSAA